MLVVEHARPVNNPAGWPVALVVLRYLPFAGVGPNRQEGDHTHPIVGTSGRSGPGHCRSFLEYGRFGPNHGRGRQSAPHEMKSMVPKQVVGKVVYLGPRPSGELLDLTLRAGLAGRAGGTGSELVLGVGYGV